MINYQSSSSRIRAPTFRLWAVDDLIRVKIHFVDRVLLDVYLRGRFGAAVALCPPMSFGQAKYVQFAHGCLQFIFLFARVTVRLLLHECFRILFPVRELSGGITVLFLIHSKRWKGSKRVIAVIW